MNQPQHSAALSPYRDYRPSYSPRTNIAVDYNSPRSLGTPNAPFAATSGGSSPLSPLQTGLPSGQLGYARASPATPVMAQAYNPQAWNQSQMGFQRIVPVSTSTREATGMEAAMPSPPPPYSSEEPAPTSSRIRPSPMLEERGFTASPTTVEASGSSSNPTVAAVISPGEHISPSFPPPPSAHSSRHRDRSSSNNRIINTFQSFAGRGKQPITNESIAHQYSPHVQQWEDARPPAARRAISAGHTSAASALQPVQLRQRGDSSAAQNGAILPGPPPGPPPTNPRSQSLNRYANAQAGSQSFEAPQPVRRTPLVSSLGPVPPTPANWVDGDNMETSDEQSAAQPYQPLRINTGGAREHSLSRRPATRDSSAQGLRERRSRSRAAREGAYDDELASALDGPSNGTISQRREHARKISVLADSSQRSPGLHHAAASVMTPPYTPAVGRQMQDPNSATSDRPSTRDGALSSKPTATTDVFYKHALERYRLFLEREAAAATDEQRLEAFANYIVHESRLRRDKYQSAYNGMAGDIVDLTRDMWRSFSHVSKRAATPNTATTGDFPSASRLDSSTGEYTPATENGSIDGESPDQAGPSRQWGDTFKPSLSPIPSMAVSSVHDDSSRGRAPSRWWEKSEGSGSIGKPERIEKSHRETKYMGINPALLRSSPQPSPNVPHQTPTPGASTFKLGPNEYPPEKVGWHDGQDLDTPMATPGYSGRRQISNASPAHQMDLSRLVTLPPPYPRHHPAINNNHPLLATLRNEHRQLADNAEVQRIKDAHVDQDWAIRRAQQDESKKRRTKMRQSTQDKLNDGEITFAVAAQAESNFEEDEVERSKANARVLFDAFEASVSHPLNTLITEKLATAEKCIHDLQKDLAEHNQHSDPNRAQEEGDEHPERLEKLTLLRWLFDAREMLHKEMFDLHAQRAEKYGEVVLTPYRIAKQQNKIDEAEAFFLKDGRQRALHFHKESLKRCEEFLSQIETNVNKGVEDQLSAFWDIAPGLREVVQHIPAAIAEDGEHDLQLLSQFDFFVPPQEIQENPAYKQFPLQYLYSVLSHAEKSTYQFIESQTNLWCLLHAVRELTTEASLSVIQLETSNGTGSTAHDELAGEMLQAKSAEEKRMTADLQEQVGEVERQWNEALGEQLRGVKLGVRHWLEETHGWEDGLDG